MPSGIYNATGLPYSHMPHRKGSKMPQSAIEKIRMANKGRIGWNRGKKMPDYIKEILHKANIGRKWTDSQRKRMLGFHNGNKYALGRKHSEESKMKMRKNQFGENNSNWQGGFSKIRTIFRNNSEYIKWFKTILKRDDYSCRDCGLKNLLQVHHEIRFGELLSMALNDSRKRTIEQIILQDSSFWDLYNGITLCQKCHCNYTKQEKKDARFFMKLENGRTIMGGTTLGDFLAHAE